VSISDCGRGELLLGISLTGLKSMPIVAAMTSPLVTDLGSLSDHVGAQLGPTEWQVISQEQVNAFADATGDHQWIHVDVERAKSGPFGGTIAHGYLTLSLVPVVQQELLDVQGAALTVNYGLDRLRFPAPVPVGSRVRASAVVSEVTEVGGGTQLKLTMTFEVEGNEKPACVAEILLRFYP
jgi:acyl dehydratase